MTSSLEALPCYLCQSDDIREIHPRVRDREDIKVMQCNKCDLVFLNRRDHIDLHFYEQSGMHGSQAPDPKAFLAEERDDLERRIKWLQDEVKGKSYLDFGAGTGHVAKELLSSAGKVAAVEVDLAMRNYITKELKIPAYASLEETGEKYDLISLFHVLEHFPDPRQELKRLATFLNPGGTIVVEVPNSQDALVQIYDSEAFKDFTYWSCHLYLFNEENLLELGRQAGLKVSSIEQVQRYPLANHLYWLAKKAPGGHKKWAQLRDKNLEATYQEKLARLKACDTLIARLH